VDDRRTRAGGAVVNFRWPVLVKLVSILFLIGTAGLMYRAGGACKWVAVVDLVVAFALLLVFVAEEDDHG